MLQKSSTAMKMNESNPFSCKNDQSCVFRNKADELTVPAGGESNFLEKHRQPEPALMADGTLGKTNL